MMPATMTVEECMNAMAKDLGLSECELGPIGYETIDVRDASPTDKHVTSDSDVSYSIAIAIVIAEHELRKYTLRELRFVHNEYIDVLGKHVTLATSVYGWWKVSCSTRSQGASDRAASLFH